MKKTMITALVLLLSAAAGAQDTVVGPYMGGNYFSNYTIARTKELTVGWEPAPSYSQGGVNAKLLNCGKDTLKIVGVAVPMVTLVDWLGWYGRIPTDSSQAWYYQFQHTLDTSMAACYEYACIYKQAGDSMLLLDSVVINRKFDTVRYVMIPESENPRNGRVPFYLYEKRFANPIVMTDSFYMGVTADTWRLRVDTVGRAIWWDRFPFSPLKYYNARTVEGYTEKKACYDDEHGWRFYYQWRFFDDEFFFFFPIVEPYGDTLSVQTVERFTSLFPNPATGRVSVFSSFGLNSVRLYSVSGAEVLRREGLSGTLATLELGALPAGTYLVHIDTPAGTAVKRLVVGG